jgi:hypothetical protein
MSIHWALRKPGAAIEAIANKSSGRLLLGSSWGQADLSGRGREPAAHISTCGLDCVWTLFGVRVSRA